MVHPDLPLSSARIVYMAVPGAASDHPTGPASRVVRIARAGGGRPGMRCLAFGVVPDSGPGHLRFSRFCRCLLEGRDWRIDDQPAQALDAPFVARRDGDLAVFAAVGLERVDEALDALGRLDVVGRPEARRCLVIPHPPRPDLRAESLARGVSVVSCQELDAWEASVGFGTWRRRPFG